MASVASQLIEEVTAHAQCDSLEDAREYAQTVLTFQLTYVLKHRKLKVCPVFYTGVKRCLSG